MLYKTTTHIAIDNTHDATSHEEAAALARRDATSIRCGGALRVLRVDTGVLSAGELETTDRLASWQRGEAAALGTDEQRERWRAGMLPDDDLFGIARDELFRPFAAFQRRKRMIPSDIAHPRTEMGWACAPSGDHQAVRIDWSSAILHGVDASEWPTVRAIESARDLACAHRWLLLAPAPKVTVSLRTHVGTCQHCHKSAHQNSALVEIPFGGRKLSREYTLEPTK